MESQENDISRKVLFKRSVIEPGEAYYYLIARYLVKNCIFGWRLNIRQERISPITFKEIEPANFRKKQNILSPIKNKRMYITSEFQQGLLINILKIHIQRYVVFKKIINKISPSI